MENRVSVKLKHPNPLFEKWLIEWREKAKEKNSKTQHAYSLALASLRKYPLPLERGRDCKILKGFGNKVCDMLDEALENHKKLSSESTDSNAPKPTKPKPRKSTPQIQPPKQIETKNCGNYIPAYRSGAYAILMALYAKFSDSDCQGFMLKKDLIKEAQIHCDTSFTKAQVGSFYTAWSSMKTLLTKKLVHKEGNPAKFSLTDDGTLLGCKLYTKTDFMNKKTPSTSSYFDENDHKGTQSDRDCIVGGTSSTTTSLMSENTGVSSSGIKQTESDEECIVLSDSDTEIDFVVSDKNVQVSDELKKLCGVFSSENYIKKDLLEPPKKKLKEDSSSKVKYKKTVSEIAEYEDFIMAPYSFDVILFVDTQETGGAQVDPKDDVILSELEALDVRYEVRNLKVGDYCWICRDRETKKEFILPYIIERKRMDDLASSIKDGRFHEQKFRLRQCGLKNVIYMIETYGTKDQHVGLPLSSLNQAMVNTLIHDGFVVKLVEGVRGLAEYLSCMSNLIKKNYEMKTIVYCPKDKMEDVSIDQEVMPLMYFLEFNKLSSKTRHFTVQDMFIKQLLQIQGLSVEKAQAIVQEYPTPMLFKKMISVNGDKSVKILSNIKYGQLGRKIGPVLSQTLFMLFSKESF